MLGETKVKSVMEPNVLTLSVTTTLRDAWETFATKKISGAPVLAEDGSLIGVVSQTDILRTAYAREDEVSSGGFYIDYPYWGDLNDEATRSRLEKTTVEEIMSRNVLSVSVNDTVSLCAELMEKHRIHRLIVTENDQVEGIVSTLGLIKLLRG